MATRKKTMLKRKRKFDGETYTCMTDRPMPKSDAKSMAGLIRYEGRKARVVKIDNRWWVFAGRKRMGSKR